MKSSETKYMMIVYSAIALSYVSFNYFFAHQFDFIHKALPAMLLAAWFVGQQFEYHKGVIAAFVFCAIGDTLLALNFHHHFVAGLGAFLVAHLFFAAVFFRFANWKRQKLPWILAVVGLAGIAAFYILPSSGELWLPVTAYICVIVMMVVGAIIAARDNPFLQIGALTFMASDLLIGIDRFVSSLPLAHFLIMISYYIALFCLALGIRKCVASNAIGSSVTD